MKVYDVLIESEKTVDEGPVRFLKRTLGKNTAMGKAAQLDVEIDKEVKSIFKDYYAVTKQDPKKAGMTASNLSNFLVAKGFAGDADSVMSYIQQDLGLGTKIAKAAVKGGKAVGKGAKKVRPVGLFVLSTSVSSMHRCGPSARWTQSRKRPYSIGGSWAAGRDCFCPCRRRFCRWYEHQSIWQLSRV